MLPEKNREGKHININEENDCDKKDENVPVEVMLAKNITLKELSKISDNTENAKDKMQKTDKLEQKYCNLQRQRNDVHSILQVTHQE